MSRAPDDPKLRPVVLSYQQQAGEAPVSIRRCDNPMEAQILAGELDAAGIEAFVVNENVNALGPYSGFSHVELQVRKADAEQAIELLARRSQDAWDVEPEQDPWADRADLALLNAYDNARDLHDAAAVLNSARVECFLPTLRPRGERPPGEGKRFLLRVRKDDMPRARVLLAEEGENREAAEPRCPRCGSWSVHPPSRPWPGLVAFLLGRVPPTQPEFECIRCHHRWLPPDQARRVSR